MRPFKRLSDFHPFRRILNSQDSLTVVLRWLLLLSILVLGGVGLYLGVLSLALPYVYMKDFIQEYLLGRATLEAVNPYLPLPELAERFIEALPTPIFPHPTPHPPFVALIALPLGFLTYQQAAIVWFLFELALIGTSTYLLLKIQLKKVPLTTLVLTFFVSLAWYPFREEIVTGQLMSLILALVTATWWAVEEERFGLAGIFLGLSMALKLMGWPILIYFLIRKNWSVVVAAGITVVVAHVIAALILGPSTVLFYYLHVGSEVSSLYRAYAFNFSLWTLGWRLFEGTGATVILGLSAPPFIFIPSLAPPVSFFVVLGFVVLGIGWAIRTKEYAAALAILVCVTILANPVTWGHYLMLLSIPLVVIGRYIVKLDFPKRETYLSVVFILLLLIPRSVLESAVLLMGTQSLDYAVEPVVPFGAGLIALLPTVLVIALMWLVRRLSWLFDHVASEACSSK